MGCVFEHTATELSERLKDTLSPILSDPNSKLALKLQSETEIKILRSENAITFTGSFSSILLANDIILGHLEQIKEEINSILVPQKKSTSLGNKFGQAAPPQSLDNCPVFYTPVFVQNNEPEEPEAEVLNFQNVQFINNGLHPFNRNRQNVGFTNIVDKNLIAHEADLYGSSSSNVESESRAALYQGQVKDEQITEQSDKSKEMNKTANDNQNNNNANEHCSSDEEYTEEINIHMNNSEKEIDVQNGQFFGIMSPTNRSSGNTKYNPSDQGHIATSINKFHAEKLLKKDQKLDQLIISKTNENEVMAVENVDYVVCESRKETNDNFCNKNSEIHIMHIENQIKQNKKYVDKNGNNKSSDNENVTNIGKSVNGRNNTNQLEPVFYQNKEIGKCVKDKKNPLMAKSSCNMCNYVTSARYANSKQYLKTHFSRNHFERELKFECDMCDKKFGTKGDLHLHGLEHKFKKCEECGKMVRCRTFHVHARAHNPIYKSIRYECDICNRKFKQKNSLKEHINAVHNTKERERIPCDICGKMMATKFSLRNHKSIIHGFKEKKHLCGICGKAFHTAEKVKSHQQKHSEVPLYKCIICLKGFRWKDGLKMHMKSHSDEREYKCPGPECGKSFKQSSSLKRHKLVHTGARPYECNICTKTFNDSSTLRRHKLGKHKEIEKMYQEYIPL